MSDSQETEFRNGPMSLMKAGQQDRPVLILVLFTFPLARILGDRLYVDPSSCMSLWGMLNRKTLFQNNISKVLFWNERKGLKCQYPCVSGLED